MLAGSLLVLIFLALSGLHGYWAAVGGPVRTGFVPELEGKPVFEPGRLASGAVAMLLLLAATVCFSQAQLLGVPRLPLARFGVWVLLIAFSLRAIGEFRLVGFFKRVRGTRFAQLDSWVYSPLCLVVSALCGALLHSTR